MNFYYDRNDFMVGHVLLNIINIIKVTLANGVKKEKKAIVNPNLLGRASKFLVRSLNNIIYCM